MAEEISQEKEKPRMHGCLKGCLIFLVVCIVTFVVTVAIIYYKREAITGWAVEKMFEGIEKALLDEVSEDIDKEKVRETVVELKTAITEGRLSEKELQKILRQFGKVMEDQKLDAGEINALLDVIREAIKEPVKNNST